MPVHRLDNASWGFPSSCFVCESTNPAGLRIPFFHDEDTGTVYADYTLDAGFSGAPSFVHGGVTMAVLDEAMSWATIAVATSFALTEQHTTVFRRPIRVGRAYRVEARLTSHTAEKIEAEAVVRNQRGEACAEATALFRPMDSERAQAAIGSELTGDDARYLRD